MKTFRLSIRDLFWLLLVVGMGCAWWMERTRMIADAKAIQQDWLQEKTLRTRRKITSFGLAA